MKIKFLLFTCLIILSSFKLFDNPKLVIHKNGKEIPSNDMSVKKDDIIKIFLSGIKPNAKYKISKVELKVLTTQPQQVKSSLQEIKLHKTYSLNTEKFAENPILEIKISDYIIPKTSRIIIKILKVEEMTGNGTQEVDWITYGKEYVFWYDQHN